MIQLKKGEKFKYKTDFGTKYGFIKDLHNNDYIVVFNINYTKPQVTKEEDVRINETNTMILTTNDLKFVTIITDEDYDKGITEELIKFQKSLMDKVSILKNKIAEISKILNDE
jgi:hypothetical protein